jgi:hypothetical protein
MIHLWARPVVDEDEQQQDESQNSKIAWPKAAKPEIEVRQAVPPRVSPDQVVLQAECEVPKPAIESKQAFPPSRSADKVVSQDQCSEITSSADLIASVATPCSHATKHLAENAESDQCSKIALPEGPVATQALKSKFSTKLFRKLPGTRVSMVAGERLSDPIAECCRQIGLLESEIQTKEQAMEKTKHALDRNDQQIALLGEGSPNLDGDTLEDLGMQLQLSALEQVREIADLCKARQTHQMILYKLCYDAEAFPNTASAMPSKSVFSKKVSHRSQRKTRAVFSAMEEKTASRDHSSDASRTW